MKLRAVAFAYAACLLLATAAWAASPRTTADRAVQTAESGETLANGATLPISWVPDWLMEPLSRAIADAGNPRDRKSGD